MIPSSYAFFFQILGQAHIMEHFSPMKFTRVRTIGLTPSLAAQNQVFVECIVHYIMTFSLFSLLENKQTNNNNTHTTLI